MFQTILRRAAMTATVLLAVAVLLLPLFWSKVQTWISESAFLHLADQGLSAYSYDESRIFAAYLPSAKPRRTNSYNASLEIDFAKATNLPYLRSTVERLGEYEVVIFNNMRPAHVPFAAQVVDSAKPNWIIFATSDLPAGSVAMIAAGAPLEKLAFQDCRIRAGALRRIGRRLTVVSVRERALDVEALAELMETPEIEGLYFSDCTFPALGGGAVPSSPTLRLIRLCGEAPGADEWIGKMTLLAEVQLNYFKLERFDPLYLSQLPCLTHLDLSLSEVDDAWLQRLPILPHISDLRLGGDDFTIEGVQTVLERTPSLRRLDTGSYGRYLGCDHHYLAELKTLYPNVTIVH